MRVPSAWRRFAAWFTQGGLECYACYRPAVTIGWGFAICGNGKCAEQARNASTGESALPADSSRWPPGPR